ncbi:MAG: YceH family protein, partial [Planctomycetota bacterium]
MQLSPDEIRVLGVLIEKAFTTPDNYPLTLNALTTGCNQKSNRHPVVDFSEDRVLDAVEKLRGQGLTARVDTYGSRVTKYRHLADEVLDVGTLELAILAELMLRGPQTLGEIRTRASRMRTLESLEVTRNVVEGLMNLPEPLIKRLPPEPGSRAERFTQLLTPDATTTQDTEKKSLNEIIPTSTPSVTPISA